MPDLDFKTIGQKIKARRVSLGFTQEYVAEILNVNPSHISNIEGGRSHPSLTVLISIANVFQCSVDYFIGSEYTFHNDENKELDEIIQDKLRYCDMERKTKILQMIDLL